ncbi:unnamed protein product [Rangifer tarandus platyrhynchus]|uniref:Uncharacterized protein n=1 Tax=Rangifer tarandus platyrhynchus TaxID=3082113 RepID=A0ABN9A777_RANTA|nr:unnamed protein product [Rangifer tarandus platyrhynchus]
MMLRGYPETWSRWPKLKVYLMGLLHVKRQACFKSGHFCKEGKAEESSSNLWRLTSSGSSGGVGIAAKHYLQQTFFKAGYFCKEGKKEETEISEDLHAAAEPFDHLLSCRSVRIVGLSSSGSSGGAGIAADHHCRKVCTLPWGTIILSQLGWAASALCDTGWGWDWKGG